MKAKIFRKVDWKGLGIRPETYHPDGVGVNYRTQLYGISYNSKLLPKDVGQKLTWESCADPSWKGKFALDVRPRHLEVLYQDDGWGKEKTLEYSRRLGANKPILERSRLEAETKLAGGAYPFICGQFWSTHRREVVHDGATHLGFAAPEPVVVSSGDIVFVTAGAKSPYAAILWLVWSVSDEGLKLLDDVQFTGDPMVHGTSAYPLLKGKKVVRGSWEYQRRADEILNDILKAMGLPVVR
jgi:ABC-type Fe3+ transport system substrate-binding protein